MQYLFDDTDLRIIHILQSWKTNEEVYQMLRRFDLKPQSVKRRIRGLRDKGYFLFTRRVSGSVYFKLYPQSSPPISGLGKFMDYESGKLYTLDKIKQNHLKKRNWNID